MPENEVVRMIDDRLTRLEAKTDEIHADVVELKTIVKPPASRFDGLAAGAAGAGGGGIVAAVVLYIAQKFGLS